MRSNLLRTPQSNTVAKRRRPDHAAGQETRLAGRMASPMTGDALETVLDQSSGAEWMPTLEPFAGKAPEPRWLKIPRLAS